MYSRVHIEYHVQKTPRWLDLPVLGLDVVSHGLGLLVAVVVVTMAVVVVHLADVFHLVDAATLRASLDGAVAGHLFVLSSQQRAYLRAVKRRAKRNLPEAS